MIKLIGMLGAKGSGKDTAARLLIDNHGFVRTSFATALYEQVARSFGVSVAFLENRDTKETPLLKLNLSNCTDENFVAVAMAYVFRQNMLSAVPSAAPSFIKPLFKAIGYLKALSMRSTELVAPRSPRWVLQLWGTEYRRRSVHGHDAYWLDKVAALIDANPDTRFVITDVRFKNEADFVETVKLGTLVRVRRPMLELREAEARRIGTLTALHPSETELLSRKVSFELINTENHPEALQVGIVQILTDLHQAA